MSNVHSLESARRDSRLYAGLEGIFAQAAKPYAEAQLNRIARETPLKEKIVTGLQASYVVAVYFILSVLEGKAGDWFNSRPSAEDQFTSDMSREIVRSWVRLMKNAKNSESDVPADKLIPQTCDLREGLQSSLAVDFRGVSDEDLQSILLKSLQELARGAGDIELPHDMRVRRSALNAALSVKVPA